MAIAGNKIFKSEFDGVMDEITGAVTVTAGNDNLWTNAVMNDLSISVGGNRASDVPFKWSGSGNSAVLGGTPPVGSFGIAANNRFFIGNTVALPSRLYWSILGNPEDWSGAGSGSVDVQTSDNDVLVGAALISYNHLLLFKQNSIHDLILSSAPFPLYPLFRNVGAVSKRGIVNVEGMIYFITPEPRMKATNGTQVFDSSNPGNTGITDLIDNVFDSLNKSRLQYLHGTYYRRLHQIWWVASSSSATTDDICIIWDLNRKCWLRHPSGFKFNSITIAQDRIPYGGDYSGKIYQLDVSGVSSDASESSPGTITSYWRTGWIDIEQMLNSKNFPYLEVNYVAQTSGTFDFGYGYDFASDRKIISVDMKSAGGLWDSGIWDAFDWGTFTDKPSMIFTKGKGKFVQFFMRNNNAGEAFSFNGLEVPMKIGAPEAIKG